MSDIREGFEKWAVEVGDYPKSHMGRAGKGYEWASVSCAFEAYQAGAAMQKDKDAKLRKARRNMKCTKVSVNGETMWEGGVRHE